MLPLVLLFLAERVWPQTKLQRCWVLYETVLLFFQLLTVQSPHLDVPLLQAHVTFSSASCVPSTGGPLAQCMLSPLGRGRQDKHPGWVTKPCGHTELKRATGTQGCFPRTKDTDPHRGDHLGPLRVPSVESVCYLSPRSAFRLLFPDISPHFLE